MFCTLFGMMHSDLISLWPSLSDFADDLGAAYGTAKAIRRRGAIPDRYWMRLSERAKARGLSRVTLQALAEAKATRAPDHGRA